MFILLAVGPLLVLVLAVLVFVRGEMEGIKSTYNIDSRNLDSPFSLFDKVMLLNSYTKSDYEELQEKARRDSVIFLDEDFQNAENQKLAEKYSFLAVIADEKFVYFGNQDFYDETYQGLLLKSNDISGENSLYYGGGTHKFLIKKLGIQFPDGKNGSACIVTNLNVSLPHITFFTTGLLITMCVTTVLVIIAVIGYTYYNIILPIYSLQQSVIHISNGELDYEIKKMNTNEFTDLYDDFENMRLILKASIEEREQADALTKEVIGNISHDLKTPLTAIKGYAEGILDGVASTPERLDKYIRTIHAKAVDMNVLVDELSYFTKIYQKKEGFQFSEVPVSSYFSSCIGDLALDLEMRDIQLLYQCDVEEETVIRLDKEKIKRVIANIIGNALKYIYHKHGVILIGITENNEGITVMIRDNGKGIEKDELPFIFDRFYRTDSSRNSKTGGSGLGLAIAKKIIDEHEGKIWADSVVEKGTAIYFFLPKQKTAKEDIHGQNTNR